MSSPAAELSLPNASSGLSAVPLDARSVRQRALEQLRRSIVRGELAAGEHLREDRVALDLEISRGPIREALRQLEQEGLIRSFPHRGCVVTSISRSEIENVLLPVRHALEAYAVPRALAHLAPVDLAWLEAVAKEMHRVAKAGDRWRIAELDVIFHQRLMTLAEEPHSLQLWTMISGRLQRFFIEVSVLHPRLVEIAIEHDDLLAALRSGDEGEIGRVLEVHILSGPLALLCRADEAPATDAA
jgi:DNA-binding GntR family transcriptional regulator